MPKLTRDQLDPRNNLQAYSPQAIRNADVWTPQMIRSEYSRLRSIARKRLERLAVAEPESYAYRHNKDRYGPVRTLSAAQLKEKLPELARFVAAKGGSVSGLREIRKATLATLRRHGYTGVTATNLKAFGEFMEEWREKKLDRTIGSPTAAEMFEFTQDKKIPWDTVKENFAQWLRNKKKLEQYVRQQERKGKSPDADDIITRFNQLEAQRQKDNRRRREKRQAAKNSGGSGGGNA